MTKSTDSQSTTVTPAYTQYLLEFVETCKVHHGVNSTPALGRIAGFDRFAQMVNWWKTNTLKRPISDNTYAILSKLDMEKRSADELKQYFENRELSELREENDALKSEVLRLCQEYGATSELV